MSENKVQKYAKLYAKGRTVCVCEYKKKVRYI